jgi:hypothetical protein
MVRFFNSDKEGNGIKSEPEASALMGSVQFNGGTPLGAKLASRVLQPMVYSQPELQKPVCVYIITDGEPDSRWVIGGLTCLLNIWQHFFQLLN